MNNIITLNQKEIATICGGNWTSVAIAAGIATVSVIALAVYCMSGGTAPVVAVTAATTAAAAGQSAVRRLPRGAVPTFGAVYSAYSQTSNVYAE